MLFGWGDVPFPKLDVAGSNPAFPSHTVATHLTKSREDPLEDWAYPLGSPTHGAQLLILRQLSELFSPSASGQFQRVRSVTHLPRPPRLSYVPGRPLRSSGPNSTCG